MPPIYDFECKKCKTTRAEMMGFDKYAEWESVKCDGCGELITKDDRVMGKGLKTTVKGVRKGNYNSNDWS